MNDLITVIWKELRKFNNTRTSKMQSLILLGMIGVYMPIMTGLDWVLTLEYLAWMWLPMFTTIGFTTDAFAGERERHTLETLLASRLPDEAILLGKILASVIYSWGICFVSLLIGAVAVNLTNPQAGLIFYETMPFVVGMFAVLLMFFLFSCLGVLVSLKAHTVRQAYQRLSFSMLAIWLLPFVLTQILPEETIAKYAAQAPNLEQMLITAVPFVVFALLLISMVLYAVARGKFKRDQLIADL
ncbi:MAG: ABC transporter permease subunit [Anaerolineaceae bacterium]|nr:ABC transporter permease subunit [Anaerolineaceae bacterium]